MGQFSMEISRSKGSVLGGNQHHLQTVDIRAKKIQVKPNPSNAGTEQLGHATGFFWKRGASAFLITNRHVLTCLDSFTNEKLSLSGYIPEKIKFFAGFWKPVAQNWIFERQTKIVDLYDANGDALWHQHKAFESLRIDVVAIPIGPAVAGQSLEGHLS